MDGWMVIALLVAGHESAATLESDDMTRIMQAVPRARLVAPQHGTRWCKSKRQSTDPFLVETENIRWENSRLSAAELATLGQPIMLKTLELQEVECHKSPGDDLWMILKEYTYADAGAAEHAEQALRRLTDRRATVAFKSVHSFWRCGHRLYFAQSGGHNLWDRFEQALKDMGTGPHHPCGVKSPRRSH